MVIVDLDGQLLDAKEARVSPFDAAYQYGDGIFDTLRAYRGFLFAIEHHVTRLANEARLLQIPFDANLDLWTQRLQTLLKANDLLDQDAAVRIQISRGGTFETDLVGAEPEEIRPVTFIQTRAVSESVEKLQTSGARIMSVQSTFARGNFPQIKSLNYLPSIMALRFARANGYDEACLINSRAEVLEGAASNLFVIKGRKLLTPPSRLGLLPGITRGQVLELAGRLRLSVERSILRQQDLLVAEEVFLTGSVKEVVPVIGVDDYTVGTGSPGITTKRIQEAYRKLVESQRPAQSAQA